MERPDVVNLPGSWIPAEAVVGVLAGRSDRLTVFHHSSSVAFYLGGVDGVDFVDLLDSRPTPRRSARPRQG